MLLNAPQRSITKSQYYSLPVVYMDPCNSIFPFFFVDFVDSNYVDYTVSRKIPAAVYMYENIVILAVRY